MTIGFLYSPAVVKIGVICVTLGTILQIVGFASPYWIAGALANEGLWLRCSYNTILKQKFCEEYSNTEEWLQSVRTLEAFGLIGALVAMILNVFSLFVKKTNGSMIIAILCSVVACGTAFFILIGVIIYLQQAMSRDNISWALGLSASGGALFGVAGVFFIVSICVLCINKSKKKKQEPNVV